MVYKIFELISKHKIEPDGYDTKTITTYKLNEEISYSKLETTHTTIECAYAEIIKNKRFLKSKILTVLPIIEIDWDGEESI